MRHKMMINEFIGRCSSNKGWRAPVCTGSLAAALDTAGVLPPGAQRPQGFPLLPARNLDAFLDPSGFLLSTPDSGRNSSRPTIAPCGPAAPAPAGPEAGGGLSREGLVEAGTPGEGEMGVVVRRPRYGLLVGCLGLGGSVLPLQFTKLCVLARSHTLSELLASSIKRGPGFVRSMGVANSCPFSIVIRIVLCHLRLHFIGDTSQDLGQGAKTGDRGLGF